MGDNMLEKIINYNNDCNHISIIYDSHTLNVIFINEDIVRFFVNFTNEDYSFAVNKIDTKNVNYSIDKFEDYIQIKSKKLRMNL